MKNIDNETKELVSAFKSESIDLLEDAELKIHNFADCTEKDECINTVFRVFHTIKGNSGYLNLKNVTSITHEAETLLDIFKKNQLKPSQVEIDIIYLACDTLKRIITQVDKTYSDKGFETDTMIISESIQELIKNRLEINNELKEEKENKSNVKEEKSKKKIKDDYSVLITKEIIEKTIIESHGLLEKMEKEVLELEKDTNNMELISSIFRDIHTIKGNVGFIEQEEIEKECMNLEEFLEKIRSGNKIINSEVISFILKKKDIIYKQFDHIQIDEKDKKNRKAIDDERNNKSEIEYKQLGEILLEIGAVKQEDLKKALDLQQSRIGEILIDRGSVSEDAVKKALDRQSAITSAKGIEKDFSSHAKEVRVNTEKLDKLFDLTGELISAEAVVINNPEIVKLNLESFEKSINYLSKIIRELQEVSMSMRMIPLEGLFTKAIRLVRDLSRKANKKVALKMFGQETEMDRKIIEELSDPLTHILRNAIDHGIENKEEREKSGKEEIAAIKLDAKYEGNEIWITISDDGRGLDRNKIIKKAKEKNLLKGDGKELTDEEIWQFTFLPGFSTAEKVTDVSGRGVGMDVVLKNIEKLKGKIIIKSTKNIGTDIILKIPLTVAIIDVVTVNVADKIYSIPSIDILEFFQPKAEQISYLKNNNQIIKLRDEMIPIIKLYDFFRINTEKTSLTEGIMVVIQREEKKAALFIENILGNQQIVIKPLSEIFGESRGLSGCSILGSGEVSLIIDTADIIKESLL